MSVTTASRTHREDRLVRRMVARGEAGLAEALCGLKGVTFGRRYVFRSLYAIGGEGAVFDVDDLSDPDSAPLVGKVALHPVHQPFDLTDDGIRERRLSLRRESVLLATCGSAAMPVDVGHHQFANPALDAGRGGAFAEAEPVLLMEKLPGVDLDRWLARVHRRGVPPEVLGPILEQFAVELLHAIADLATRGFLYADLRPGNLRVVPSPARATRLLDAGSIVRDTETAERFPHVPAYLPPDVFRRISAGLPIAVSPEVMAVMAGRSLFEIATGEPPYPGEPVDVAVLAATCVSPRVSQVVAALAGGEIDSVAVALEHLHGCVAAPQPRRVHPRVRTSASASVPAAAPERAGAPDARPEPGEDWRPADFLCQGDVAMPDAPPRFPAAGQSPPQRVNGTHRAARPNAQPPAPSPPALWKRGVLRRLLDAVMRLFGRS